MKNTLIAGAIAALLAATAQAQTVLTAETASPNTAPGVSVISLSEVASKAGIADIQVATGQTLTNSVQNVAEGKTDIAAAPFILPFLLARAVGPYGKLTKEEGAELVSNLAVLYTYRISVQGLYAFDSSGVKGWDDLEGRTIYNGPPRGAALTNARLLIKLNTGMDEGDGYDGVQVTWGQAVKTITDGSADAFVLPMAFPDGRITAALASGDMTIWSVPKATYDSEAFQNVGKLPGTVPVTLPIADMGYAEGTVTIVSEDDMFRGPGTVGGEVVNKSMDFDMAKALTAAFIAGLDDVYRAKAPFMPNAWHGETDIAFTDMCGANPVKYHPGAVAAWEEAGYTIPDCAK
ncbi:TAXI family TRAP transporter solute-binding subunit [Pseudaestuariivita atlantica]|uniref:C4-dicarboxylate ABC transporter substrate-binding protein n=1 Tax=Pseudaestuariivita atlantica TaxID=1317121 RepID=A0A0L1JTM1_9RHOB|nr:TAXI family TRAP transporter solute-binding subunit [Pseudaestuariivita atlantica]KNG95111.1 C4-dicarboxylate ABC transporter substrate-binding protein [Pseudaestuariivita atlantica]